jgi:hypothetical protein
MRLLLLLLAGCTAAQVEVSVLGASPQAIDTTQPDADLTIRVHYRDPDGDLGNGSAEIQDCRAASLVTKLALPAIATDQAVKDGVAIEGELDLVVAGVTRVTPDTRAVCNGQVPAADRAVFCVTLIDHSGHRSAPACTQAISIQ